MNTERSDEVVRRRRTAENRLKRDTIAYGRRFNTTPERLFPLLCPTTEYDWLPGWRCELLHSDSGYAEYNALFRTDFFGDEELWACTRFEPGRAIEYARTAADYCAKMEITLSDHGDGSVTGTWVIRLSALNERGNRAVEALPGSIADMEAILDALAHYAETGIMKG